MSETPNPVKRSRYHGWIPIHPEVYKAFVKDKVTKAKKRKEQKTEHTAGVTTFSTLVLEDTFIYSLFEQIFLQVNTDSKWVDPNYVVTDFETLFHLLDVIVQEPPAYYVATTVDGTVIGEPVGVPMYLVFDMLSNTSAAYDLFRYPPYNAGLQKLLDYWGAYLKSDGSNSTLTTGDEGWFGSQATTDIEAYIAPLSFEQTYGCSPAEAQTCYASWDAFFTREFTANARPVLFPDNNNYIHNACESATLRWSTNVQLHDTFWLKDQEYSLYDMLNKDDSDAQQFVGGTVYQAFLSPLDYHRWHSPINGTITKTVLVPGTYYAVLPDDGAPADDPDLREGDPHGALIRSQPWLSVAAARALIFISNDTVGVMCFIAIGMAEVSTCEISVSAGDTVTIGQELGLFHFGGSSHALIFGPQVQVTFEGLDEKPLVENYHYWINRIIAKVTQN